jgi:hypothetical protein
MKPRLLSSKKWTPLPKAFITQIEQVFNDAFAAKLATGQLIVEGSIYPEEIVLRVGFIENGRLQQDNFEISIDYSQKKQDAVDRIHNCIDAAASMMNEFFESDGEVDFPRQWKNFDFNGQIVWAQYTTENSKLEQEANRILGLAKKDLVREDESEDAIDHSDEIIASGEDEEDDDHHLGEGLIVREADEVDLSRPSIFSPKKNKKKKEDLH